MPKLILKCHFLIVSGRLYSLILCRVTLYMRSLKSLVIQFNKVQIQPVEDKNVKKGEPVLSKYLITLAPANSLFFGLLEEIITTKF